MVFPSSGRIQSCRRTPPPFRLLFQGGPGKLTVREVCLAAKLRRAVGVRGETKVSPSSPLTRQFMGGSEERPVSTAWMGRPGRQSTPPPYQTPKTPEHGKMGSPDVGRDEHSVGAAVQGELQQVAAVQPQDGPPVRMQVAHRSSRRASSSASSRPGSRIRLCTLRTLSPFL